MTRAELVAIATDAAREFGLPVRGYLAQIRAESNWDPLAVSPQGAMGLAQITPAAMADTGIQGDPFDPRVNLRIGAAYMIWARNWLGSHDLPNSWPYVLGAYNAGIGRVQTAVLSRGAADWLAGMPAETRSYVSRLAPAYAGAPTVPPALPIIGLALVALIIWSTA